VRERNRETEKERKREKERERERVEEKERASGHALMVSVVYTRALWEV
jgi:hypothetical protein